MPFTDPRDGSVYDIIDGRVIIAFVNQPIIPVVDPNYFDTQRPLNDPYYLMTDYSCMIDANGQCIDPEVAAFLTAENLEVYSEWPAVGGMGVLLPTGGTVLDAVQNWPSEYSNLIACADPDAALECCDFPESMPNDDVYDFSKSCWHLFSDNLATAPDWWIPPDEPSISPFSCDASSAWGSSLAALGGGIHIGIFDTGVDYTNPGLQSTSAFHGINTYDKAQYTAAMLRTLGGGEPWDELMERSQAYASGLGHGTLVAGTACAEADDDESSVADPYDVLGVAPGAKYFPFAIKAKGYGNEEDGFHATCSMSALLNAFTALGGVTGIYEESLFEDPVTGA